MTEPPNRDSPRLIRANTQIGFWAWLRQAIGYAPRFVWIFTIIGGLAAAGSLYFAYERWLNDEPKPPKEVRFIFDTGEGGGAGTPGNDVYDGIDQAVTAGLQIRYLIQNDNGDKSKAKELAEKAANDPNVIAVVGHLSSSIMSEVLPIYVNANVPVPLIMPVPTNPNLTSTAYKNVIRLPPTDYQQAQEASDFFEARPNIKRIAVIRDADNLVYSQYLSAKFIANVRDEFSKKSTGPTIVYEGIVGAGSSGGFFPTIFTQLHIDAVYFAGSTDNAITLLESLNASNLSPLILMTDGVVDAKFLKKLSAIPDNLYVTFQLPRDRRTHTVDIPGVGPPCADRFAEFELSFCPYGYDSVQILRQILQKVINGGRVDQLSRQAILNYFATLRTGRETLHGEFNDYRFDTRGDNIQFGFAVWKASRQTKKFEYFPWRNGG